MRQIPFPQLKKVRDGVRQTLARKGSCRVLCIAGLTALLVLCIWLPYLLVGRTVTGTLSPEQTADVPEDTVLPLADRAGAFGDFLAAETEPEPLEASFVTYDRRRQGKTVTDWVLDTFPVDRQAGSLGASATLYYDISCGENSFRVFHAYREWFGDWNNWVSLYADADTGEIYSLYVSCGCRSNGELYGAEHMDIETLARLLARQSGYTMEAAESTGEQTGVCFVSDRTGAAVFDLKCMCYPASLIDYTWVIRPHSAEG